MERIIVYTNPASPVAEAYRALCTNVLAGQENNRIIEVAGLAEDNNSSLVTANLAVAMAQAGKRVLLIDCNLRNPKQHELFGLQNHGFADALTAPDALNGFLQQTAQQNLHVLTAGVAVMNPVEVLMNPAMQHVLSVARAAYDIVLIDVPAVSDVADGVALGTKTDGVLLVLTNKEDKVEQAQKAKEMFIQANVPILGCVLDKA